ncbi:uncharacterized protein EKO05_0010860 [Ascochyta rabiei]|uniref:Uncharacterized protein n=1 Tax=Didymella rabiei TaxID=5454 RepID=A0A162ZT70_DIDRA|nr:uncharacterized protein EKO05_0010860 [Ascochyta rabiei]KZM20791.1 hypothetical protein ST47_g8061 [Ascochyta rabiei]UPX20632.1 hypothetical protein EKO05_0010860 [Ascochyta rabiei]
MVAFTYLPLAITALLLMGRGIAAAPSIANELSQQTACGSVNGPCDENGCAGFNDPAGGSSGVCSAGQWAGCHCQSVCGSSPGPCNENGCEGQFNLGTGIGQCQAGKYRGWLCK